MELVESDVKVMVKTVGVVKNIAKLQREVSLLSDW